MSLLDIIRDQGDKIIDEKGDGYLDRLVAEGRKSVAATTKDATSPMSKGMAEATGTALDIFAANKPAFKALSKVVFANVLAHWENGNEAEARRQFLATKATFEERRAAMHAAGDAVAAMQKAREEAWESVAYVLRKVGETGIKVLVKAAVATLI